MAHEYSVQIHEWIKDRIDNINQQLNNSRKTGDSCKESFYNGQLDQLKEIRQYLTESIDLDTQTYYR